MQTAQQVINRVVSSNVLTETQEQPTKAKRANIAEWAGWLRLQTHNDPQIEAMVERVAEYMQHFKANRVPSWLSLLGTCGTGKTHCAQKVWVHLYNRTRNWSPSHVYDGPRYIERPIYWPALIRDLRNGQRYEELADMAGWPVLFLDDIGAERDTTGFAAEQLNTLLGSRVRKWTILTSNLMLEQLASIDLRIADRIVREPGNQFIEVDTVSHSQRRFRDGLPFKP